MTAPRRRLLPAVVLLALVAAVAGAMSASAPSRLPGVALDAVLVWRVEIAASVFVVAYVVVLAIHLALHGQTFTRVGSTGVEIPEVAMRSATRHESRVAAAELAVFGGGAQGVDRRDRHATPRA